MMPSTAGCDSGRDTGRPSGCPRRRARADRAQGDAPQRAGRAAGVVRPGVAGAVQHGLGTGPGVERLRAAADAAREPRCMPMPWSPSPATASMRPSSSTLLVDDTRDRVEGLEHDAAACPDASSAAGITATASARPRSRWGRAARPLRPSPCGRRGCRPGAPRSARVRRRARRA